MGENRSISVNIYGHSYRLRSPQGENHISELATELNGRMHEIANITPELSTHQVAVLAALRILEELNELKDEYAKGFQLALFKDFKHQAVQETLGGLKKQK
ncbi:cell division protein ZapA [Clostridium sp. 'deep sea']|uniref:cell division protein ZapA n=1 Tax=Clostridium sp. 'deep sea' TaxID=2779445 RepID=UPI0018969D5A|nr:cell division protein ZapA [Clostridium sp. 'deep sea']QOR35629.1 cell division protein ZapA [Clostridium sp. 'deep sea']